MNVSALLMDNFGVVAYDGSYGITNIAWDGSCGSPILNLPSAPSVTAMAKCRNKYKDHTIIAFATNYMATPPYTLFIADVNSKSILNTSSPFSFGSSQDSAFLISDSNNLYLLNYNSIFKYKDGGTFEQVAYVPGASGNFKSGVVYQNGLFLLYAGPGMGANIVYYNTVSKALTMIKLPGFTSTVNLFGADIYYDTNDSILYAGFVEFDGVSLKGYWYKNQMN